MYVMADESPQALVARASANLVRVRSVYLENARIFDQIGEYEAHREQLARVASIDDLITIIDRIRERLTADFRDDRDDRGVIGLDDWQELSATDRMKEQRDE